MVGLDLGDAKWCFNFYNDLKIRKRRLADLEKQLDEEDVDEATRYQRRQDLYSTLTKELRMKRRGIRTEDFDTIAMIGSGGFSKV